MKGGIYCKRRCCGDLASVDTHPSAAPPREEGDIALFSCQHFTSYHWQRGETSARGMMTSSPSPRTRQRGAASMSHAGGGRPPPPCLLPLLQSAPSFPGTCWSTHTLLSVYPAAPRRGSGPLTLGCRIEPHVPVPGLVRHEGEGGRGDPAREGDTPTLSPRLRTKVPAFLTLFLNPGCPGACGGHQLGLLARGRVRGAGGGRENVHICCKKDTLF